MIIRFISVYSAKLLVLLVKIIMLPYAYHVILTGYYQVLVDKQYIMYKRSNVYLYALLYNI